LATRNLKLKYKNSTLGFFWSLLTPLLYLIIFTIIFSQAFPNIENYPLFALTGLVFWTFFANASNQVVQSVVASAGILKSVNVPTIIFPVSNLIAELFNLMLSFIPFVVLMYFFGFRPAIETIFIIPFLIMFSMFTLGFSLIICTFNVFYRDIGILWNTLLPALFYFTPIAYSAKLIPEKYVWALKFNPLFHFINMVRDILYYNSWPSLDLLAIVASLSIVFFIAGLWVFRKLERGFISNF
ncbi:MAG: ABC transporter permease, partial [Bacteroidia bacterium]|nr:ABC transporter permease [Bacteroidia bacterium]